MSQDIRRMSREELDEINRQIAIRKAAGNPTRKPKDEVRTNSDEPKKRDTKAEQLELL